MIKAVLFDLDGTLVNSIEDLADAANYGLSMLNFPTHETEKYKYFVGNGMPDLIRRVLPEDKRDSDTHSKLFDIFVICGIDMRINARKRRAVLFKKISLFARYVKIHGLGFRTAGGDAVMCVSRKED